MKDGRYTISRMQVKADSTAILRGDQIKREGTEDKTEEPPSKKTRWDASIRAESAPPESASDFRCKGNELPCHAPQK